MDISATTAPDSTQINAEDFFGGPQTVTITAVRAGTAEQPVNIDLAEFPDRAYRPGKSMRRVLVAAWGPDSEVYVGRRLTLYCDPNITFGRDRVGGIRVSHLSHIAKPLTLALTVTRGKRAPHVVQPLKEEAPAKVDSSRAIGAFAGIGVTEDRLAARIGRDVKDWTPRDLASLQAAFLSIKNGRSTVQEQFPLAEEPTDPQPSLDPSHPDYDPTVDPNSGYEPPAEDA